MGVSPRISGALAALVIAAGACADAPTAPDGSNAVPNGSPNLKAMTTSSSAIGDEGIRLAVMVENHEQRVRLSASLDRLALAMEAGDVPAARRALAAARQGLSFIQSDADRDALSLVLDAADESLSSTIKHGATR